MHLFTLKKPQKTKYNITPTLTFLFFFFFAERTLYVQYMFLKSVQTHIPSIPRTVCQSVSQWQCVFEASLPIKSQFVRMICLPWLTSLLSFLIILHYFTIEINLCDHSVCIDRRLQVSHIFNIVSFCFQHCEIFVQQSVKCCNICCAIRYLGSAWAEAGCQSQSVCI